MQLPAQTASFSATQEVVSIVTTSATVWSIVPMLQMKRTVVSRTVVMLEMSSIISSDWIVVITCHRHNVLCVSVSLTVTLRVNGSDRLQFRIGSSLFTVCADTWNSHLSVFTCQYLGYR